MATELTTPITHGEDATSQIVDKIEISLSENTYSIVINDYNSIDKIIASQRHTFPIKDENGDVILPATIEVEAKDLHRVTTTAAKNAGWIGDGTTTDDI